jgi:hypothetical protein
MKFVELQVHPGSDVVAFVNPNTVMTVEANSRTSRTSKLYFGGANNLTVVGRPEDVVAALERGLE